MRCPDCGHVLPDLKPEVIVKKEPCECGLEEGARVARYAATAFIALFLSLFGGCWVSNHYSAQIAKKGQTMDDFGHLHEPQEKK